MEESDVPPITYTPPPGFASPTTRRIQDSFAKTSPPGSRQRHGLQAGNSIEEPKARSSSQTRILQSFLLSLQLTLVSLFALNSDFFWKITCTILAFLFVVLTILVKIPCLFNCFADFSEVQANGLTIVTLRLILDYAETGHGIIAVFLLFRMGGRVKRLIQLMEQLNSQPGIPFTASKGLVVGIILWSVFFLSSATLQVTVTGFWNPRHLFRAYRPDRLKLYEASEGAGTYVYKYQPLIDMTDTDYLILSALVKFLSIIHAHLLELVSLIVSGVVCNSLVSASIIVTDNRMAFVSHRVADHMTAVMGQANRLLAPLFFTSLLFNSMYVIFESVIVLDMSGIYILPKTGVCDAFKLLVSMTCIITMMNTGSRVTRTLNDGTKRTHVPAKVDILSPGMRGIIVLVVGVTAFAAIIVSGRLKDVSLHMDYQSNWTFNWMSEADMSTESELRERMDEGFMQIPVQYPWPPHEVKKLRLIPGMS